MSEHSIERAVVVGGSVAGLAAAAALSPRCAEVVVVEHRAMPAATSNPVTIAPQGRFPHALLAGGAAALERLVPGFAEDLYAHGATGVRRGPRPVHWWASGMVRHSLPDVGVVAPMCSRPLVESRLREQVRRLTNVHLTDGHVVRGLRISEGRTRGVEAEVDGASVSLDADLVVDASGRGSSAPRWLERAGFVAPPVRQVEVGITYTAVELRRSPGDVSGAEVAVVQNTPGLARIGVALPGEGDRWLLALGGYFGDAAPTDRAGFLAFAASLPDPAIRDLLDNEWLTDLIQYRFPSSQRRHWEKLRRLPAGFAVIGDAVASFNPIYGQGMSSAAVQAEVLARAVDRFGVSDRLGLHVARRTSRVVENPWKIATGGDFVYRQTRGAKAPGTDALNRYLERVFAAAAVDDEVNLTLTQVTQLLAPPPSLLRPGIVRRVRTATRRSGRQIAQLTPERPAREPQTTSR